IVATAAGAHRVSVRAPGYREVASTETAVAGRLIPVEATLQPIPASLSITAVPGARVVLDGNELGFAPLSGSVEAAPGPHRISVTAPGRIDFRTTLTAERGAALTVDARTPHTTQRRVAWGMLGGAGGLAIAGGVTVGLALLFQSRVRDLDTMRATSNLQPGQRADYNRDLARRDGLRGATIGLWSAAALAGITGLVLILADRPGPRRRGR
ncbi:MAG: PEGA domain-containing protein, partial [Myxococcota bacterium]